MYLSCSRMYRMYIYIHSQHSETFIHNNTSISDKKGIANGFNHFFTNIGPNLAKKIVPPKEGNIYNYLNNCNSSSMELMKRKY